MSRPRAARRLAILQLLVFAALAAGGALFARIPTDGAVGTGAESALARTVATPDNAGRENDLGNQLQLAGDLDGAEAAYRRAIAAAPDDALPHYNLGSLLLDRGRRLSARRELLRALELEPGNAEARFALGTVYDELGVDWLARKSYRQAFELEPALADPRLHPEAARRRLALAALLDLWHEEDAKAANESDAAAAGTPAPRAKSPSTAAAPESPTPSAPADSLSAAPATRAGGYARITGGERTDRSAQSLEDAEPPVEVGSQAPGERKPHARTRSAADTVIGPTDLGSGVSVNQVVAPGESPRGGRATGFPSKPMRSGGSRFVPPSRPIQPPDAPSFVPDEESTGRIEPLLLPVDADLFVIAG